MQETYMRIEDGENNSDKENRYTQKSFFGVRKKEKERNQSFNQVIVHHHLMNNSLSPI